uniref:Uncharacterized protein n=1 Tax=Panagrolaimus sp. ES5 TaxID=591445 RepID=A0AC34F4B8_9BILA
EEGEVTPEDETTKSPSINKRESPPLKPNESRKRPLPPKPSKAEKPKQMDYVYVINDRQKPPDKMPKQEAKSLLKQDIRPPPGFLESRPRPRHQSPPYMFDSQPHPSQQQQQSPYYDDYRMMQRPPSNQYHLTPPYAQRQQMPPNGYAAAAGGYSPQYQSTFRHPQQQQAMQQPGNHYYRPAVNGGPAPWHMDRPPSVQPQYSLQQRPPGESWTGWRN